MKFLVFSALLAVLTSFHFAQADTVIRLEKHGTLLHWDYPQGQTWEVLGCLAAGHPVMGEAFAASYPVNEIWIDQVSLAPSGSGLTYTARLSAPINGHWRHRYYQMTTIMSHTCTAGSPILLSETAD